MNSVTIATASLLTNETNVACLLCAGPSLAETIFGDSTYVRIYTGLTFTTLGARTLATKKAAARAEVKDFPDT